MSRPRKQARGFRRQPRIADQMTPDLYRCVDRSLAAERAGDGGEALEWHRAVPMFRRSRLASHDSGALDSFVREHVTGRLADHGELALLWARAPMGAFQLGESLTGSRLQVRRATGGPWVEALDIGARACAPYGWVMGRLVPSEFGGPLMFDMPPVAVPEAFAVEVAESDDWFGSVRAAVETGRLPAATFLREDYELATDVGERELLRFGTVPLDLPRVMQQLRDGRDEVSRAAFRVLARASRGELEAADQAYVAAAAQNIKAYGDARRKLVGTGPSKVWSDWADIVEPPARQMLRSLAEG